MRKKRLYNYLQIEQQQDSGHHQSRIVQTHQADLREGIAGIISPYAGDVDVYRKTKDELAYTLDVNGRGLKVQGRIVRVKNWRQHLEVPGMFFVFKKSLCGVGGKR